EDPVEAHVVASLARPGGNITGVTSISNELYGKRLELLKDMLPGLARIGVLTGPRNPSSVATLGHTQNAAQHLGLHVHIFEITTVEDLERAFAHARSHRVQAVVG